MKPDDRARLKSQDAMDAVDEEPLFEEPGGYEPDEEDFEELKEE